MSKTRSKKVSIPIDLSGSGVELQENGTTFVVKDYDYETLANTRGDAKFESDLDYLLNKQSSVELSTSTFDVLDTVLGFSDFDKKKNKNKKTKSKALKISIQDVTKDIEDLNFSSDSENEEPAKPTPKLRNKKSSGKLNQNRPNGKKERTSDDQETDNEKGQDKRNRTLNEKTPHKSLNRQKSVDFRRNKSESLNADKKLDKSKSLDFKSLNKDDNTGKPQSLRKKASMNKLQQSMSLKDSKLPAKLDEIETESEGEDSLISANESDQTSEPEKEKRRLKNKRRKERRIKSQQLRKAKENKETDEDGRNVPGLGKIVTGSVEDIEDSVEVADPEITLDSIFDNDADTTAEISPKRSDEDGETDVTEENPPDRKVKFGQDILEQQKKPSIEETVRLNRKKSMEMSNLSAASDTANPFDIKLRPTKKTTMNSKYANKLPEIQPIKTIIGLSHKQILNLDASDVKLKTILSSSKISKYSSTALNFTIKQSDSLFKDPVNKKIFFLLCVNVALYESIGFKKTVKLHPNILELFGGYTEINLETTKTKLTPSNKDIHKNTLDYSVLSYIGNIFIWALHQQRVHGETLIDPKYDLGLSASLVRENVGGYHLWDRLIREPTGMNAKRWKHITKFRQAFAYEEDQFVLILKFMGVDS